MEGINCISVDWLQLNCFFKDEIHWNPKYYEVELRSGGGTQHFNKIEYIKKRSDGSLIATAASEPNKKGIDEKTVLVKFENKVLYQNELVWEVREFLGLNNLQFRNITRLDVACDFVRFAFGREVPNFLRDFAVEKVMRLGKSTFVECGEGLPEKYDLINDILSSFDNDSSITKKQLGKVLSQKIKKISTDRYKIVGQVRQRLNRDYLRFGTHTSEVSAYIYNKTKEQLQVHYKPWIVENWNKCGLISNETFAKGIDKCPDVWRCEVSFKGSRKVLKKHALKKEDEKEITFSDLEMIKPESIELLWKAGVDQYFSFVKNDGTRRKRYMERIILFDLSGLEHVLINRSGKKDSSRRDKIAIRYLERLNVELQGTDDDLAEGANNIRQFLIYSRGVTHLNEKTEIKISENTIEDLIQNKKAILEQKDKAALKELLNKKIERIRKQIEEIDEPIVEIPVAPSPLPVNQNSYSYINQQLNS